MSSQTPGGGLGHHRGSEHPALLLRGDPDFPRSPQRRHLMDRYTFIENFNNQGCPFKTYLCYEVERLDGDTVIPLDEYKRFVCNKGPDQPHGPHHAEFYFLEQIRSRNLDQNQRYRLTCFISWSPCHSCAHNLTTFLKENRHISLRIFASRLYTSNRFGDYQKGLCELQEAGAQITIMTSQGEKRNMLTQF
ncbi:DNA dC-_dU-editing enzyme APOBEC-3A-like isoform X2 [Odocoileus virginianus]|uniref:DNA dC->dU-editing enzyme APOBEC-3G n=1 Tax=Odocoileus virginianus TaxID=9874 RepID=A0ABM4H1J5_ODOVR